MTASYQIDREQNAVLVRLSGFVDNAELDDVRRRIREDPGFAPTDRYLVDMRAVTVLAYSSSRVRHVAMTQIFRGGQRRAIVAATDEQYGVARMFATFAALEGEVAEVFREWAPAVEWLGLTGALALDSSHAVTAE